MRGLLQYWTESSIIHDPRERSVWRNKKPKKRTVFAEDRSLTWSTSTSRSLEPTMAREMRSPRHVVTREGPELACVRSLLLQGLHMQGEGRVSVLPWYPLVGVANTSSESRRRKSRAVRKGKWPPRGTGTAVLTYPWVTGWSCCSSAFKAKRRLNLQSLRKPKVYGKILPGRA